MIVLIENKDTSKGGYMNLVDFLGLVHPFIAIFFVFPLHGRDHFTDLFSPFLWQWMLVYGFVIVVLGQSFWIKALKASSVSVASLISSFTPLVSILAAYFILGEAPTMAHYIGGSLILVGVLLSQIGIRRQASLRTGLPKIISTSAQHKVERYLIGWNSRLIFVFVLKLQNHT